MPFELFLSPQGHLHVREVNGPDGTGQSDPAGKRILAAFSDGPAQGLLHLATTELQSSLAAPLRMHAISRGSISRGSAKRQRTHTPV